MKAFRKVALVACMAMCAGLLFAKGVKVEAGSGDDPFAGTAWIFKGMEVLTFKDGGKVEHGSSIPWSRTASGTPRISRYTA